MTSFSYGTTVLEYSYQYARTSTSTGTSTLLLCAVPSYENCRVLLLGILVLGKRGDVVGSEVQNDH
jgi:hypothetical protein